MNARDLGEVSVKSSFEPFINILNLTCAEKCEQINVRTTLCHLIDTSEQISEIFEDNEWIKVYIEGGKKLSTHNEIKQYKLPYTGWEITLIRTILEGLSVRHSPQKLRQAIFDYYDFSKKCKANEIIIKFLKDAGILNAIQYILCVALLTGGKNDNELDIPTLNKLLENAAITWEELLGNESFLLMQMITEQDNPAIPLTYFKKNTYSLNLLCVEANVNETLLQNILNNAKTAILQKIIQDLPIPELLKIRNFRPQISYSTDLCAQLKRKVGDVSLFDSTQEEIKNLLTYISLIINELNGAKVLSADMQAMGVELLKHIELEKQSVAYISFDGIYNCFKIFLAHVNIDPAHIKSASTFPAFTMLASKHYVDYTHLQRALKDYEQIMFAAVESMQGAAMIEEKNPLNSLLQIMCDWFKKALHIEDRSPAKNTFETIVLLRLMIVHIAFKLNITSVSHFIDELTLNKTLLSSHRAFVSHEYISIYDTFIARLHDVLTDIASYHMLNPIENYAAIVKQWGITQISSSADEHEKRAAMQAQINQILESIGSQNKAVLHA